MSNPKLMKVIFRNIADDSKLPIIFVFLKINNTAAKTSTKPVKTEYNPEVPITLQNKISLSRLPNLLYKILGSGR